MNIWLILFIIWISCFIGSCILCIFASRLHDFDYPLWDKKYKTKILRTIIGLWIGLLFYIFSPLVLIVITISCIVGIWNYLLKREEQYKKECESIIDNKTKKPIPSDIKKRISHNRLKLMEIE